MTRHRADYFDEKLSLIEIFNGFAKAKCHIIWRIYPINNYH